MKKHLSVFSLIARESIYRIVFLWLISAAFQTAALYFSINEEINELRPSVTSLFERTHNSLIPIIFYITLVLTGILLSKTGMQFNSKIGYTLRRLRISEKSVFCLQSIYNSLILCLLLIFEVLLCFILVNFCVNRFPEEFITNQTVYKTFYESDFIHNIFSGRDILRIIRNSIALISLAVNFALFSYLFRRGKKWIGAVISVAVSYLLFVENQPMSELPFDIGMTAFYIVMIFAAAAFARVGGEQYD